MNWMRSKPLVASKSAVAVRRLKRVPLSRYMIRLVRNKLHAVISVGGSLSAEIGGSSNAGRKSLSSLVSEITLTTTGVADAARRWIPISTLDGLALFTQRTALTVQASLVLARAAM